LQTDLPTQDEIISPETPLDYTFTLSQRWAYPPDTHEAQLRLSIGEFEKGSGNCQSLFHFQTDPQYEINNDLFIPSCRR
jgi:hypothetical protein